MFDSGAECSLITESLAQKFAGKRVNNTVTLIGIGKASVTSNSQILATVIIQDYPVELLFHVVPDYCLTNEVMIGRDLISLGFCVKLYHNHL